MYGSMWVEEVSHWQKWDWGWFGGSEVGDWAAVSYILHYINYTIFYYGILYCSILQYQIYLFRRGVGAGATVDSPQSNCLFVFLLLVFVCSVGNEVDLRVAVCGVWGDLRWGSICQFSRRHHLTISCHSFFCQFSRRHHLSISCHRFTPNTWHSHI